MGKICGPSEVGLVGFCLSQASECTNRKWGRGEGHSQPHNNGCSIQRLLLITPVCNPPALAGLGRQCSPVGSACVYVFFENGECLPVSLGLAHGRRIQIYNVMSLQCIQGAGHCNVYIAMTQAIRGHVLSSAHLYNNNELS